jgi:hypothetical protein
MKTHSAKSAAVMVFAVAAIFCVPFSWPFQKDGRLATIPVSIVVSVEAKHGREIPVIYREDVRVFHDQERLQVTGWTPMQGEQAGLELFMLIDDSSDTSVGSQLDDLSKFIRDQPATTTVAVGYIRYGAVMVTRNFTADHALAAKALRIPLGAGGGMASPYLAITDLIKRWPESANRREIFMVSSGIDALQPGPSNPYLQDTIEKAQQAGIQVCSIYASGAGHVGHSIWRLTWGQNNLSQLADETGGEAYFQGLQMPLSFGPYLDQFADRLKHQYRLTFLARIGKKAGHQHIKLETEVPNAELVAADDVYVPGAK